MKCLVILILCLTVIACTEPSNKLSDHVNKMWAEKLADVDVFKFYLVKHAFSDSLGVCADVVPILKLCQIELFIESDFEHIGSLKGLYGLSSRSGWVVHVPETVKALDRKHVQEIIDEALRLLVEDRRHKEFDSGTW